MRDFLKCWLPLIIWVVVMFFGSSDLLSAEHTSRFIVPILLWLNPAISPQTMRSIMSAIRKSAHLGEYAILALLLWRALRSGPTVRMTTRSLFGAVLLGCAVFAATDEFHQSFVRSRTASVRDVLLDIAGAVVGLLIGASFTRHRKRSRSTTESHFVDVRL